MIVIWIGLLLVALFLLGGDPDPKVPWQVTPTEVEM